MQIMNLWLKEAHGCENNPEKSSTIKVAEYVPSSFSISMLLYCKSVKKKNDLYKSLKVHAIEIINFEKRNWFH